MSRINVEDHYCTNGVLFIFLGETGLRLNRLFGDIAIALYEVVCFLAGPVASSTPSLLLHLVGPEGLLVLRAQVGPVLRPLADVRIQAGGYGRKQR